LAAALPASAATTVKVLPGQNLSQIAAKYGTSVTALAAENGITNPNIVVLGSILTIPTSSAPAPAAPSAATTSSVTSSVVVQVGDTLSAIAARHGTTVSALVSANGLSNPNLVVVGTHLSVPGAAATATVTSSTAPATSTTAISSSLPPQLLAYPSRVALRPLFVHWATAFGISPALLEALGWWESGWQAGVVSSTGAVGIGQLEPSTVTALRAQLGQPNLDPTVPSDNIEMAAAYLHDLLVDTGGSVKLALASYYQGLGSLQQSGVFASSVVYVSGILAYVPAFS
jgi:LysM repeat protein